MYKIIFLDKNGNEFMGTTAAFTTDGRYSRETIDEVARDTARKNIHRDDITGYNVYRGSFNNPVAWTVAL